MVRICVIGAGRIGRAHVESVADNQQAQLKYVVNPTLETAIKLAEPFGAKACSGIDEALDANDFDAVIIASPTVTHVPLIEKCARQGKHILCEKPFDWDLQRVD